MCVSSSDLTGVSMSPTGENGSYHDISFYTDTSDHTEQEKHLLSESLKLHLHINLNQRMALGIGLLCMVSVFSVCLRAVFPARYSTVPTLIIQ